MGRIQIKDNILISLTRNMCCTIIPHPVWIYIFNVISDGDDTSKPGVNSPVALYSHRKYNSIHIDDVYFSCLLGIPTLHNITQCNIFGNRVLCFIISLREMLTSQCCRVLSERGRRTRPEWRSQWQAHRSKTGKCQTPSARQRFYARLASATATPPRQLLLWIRILCLHYIIKKLWLSVNLSQFKKVNMEYMEY